MPPIRADKENPMFSTSNPALADYRVDPHELQALAGFIGGLRGAALAAAIIGGLLGYAVACKIDRLPAALGIGLGIIVVFGIANIPVVPTF
jgi:hypothetical protein